MRIQFWHENLRNDLVFGGIFADRVTSDKAWRVVSVGELPFELAEGLAETLAIIFGDDVPLEQFGFLAKFEDGIAVHVYPPKIFKSPDNKLVLKFGEFQAFVEPKRDEEGKVVTSGEDMVFVVGNNGTKATLVQVPDQNLTKISLLIAHSKQHSLNVPVACEKGANKLAIEDFLEFDNGSLDVYPIPDGNPSEGTMQISRGKQGDALKYPVLAARPGGDKRDVLIKEVKENKGEYGGFTLLIEDREQTVCVLFSNSNLNNQLNCSVFLSEEEAKALDLETTTTQWQVINKKGGFYLRVFPEREFSSGQYTAQALVQRGKPKFFLESPTLKQLTGGTEPQLKSAAVEAEVQALPW